MSDEIKPSSATTSGPEQKKSLLLRPKIHASVARFLADSALPRQLTRALGSPLNVLFPDLLRENLAAYRAVLAKHQVTGRIFFAHKTTLSDSIVRQLAVEQVNLDVASLNELRHGLSCGFDGARIEATGPKSAEFLMLCVLHGVTVNIDSVSELKQLIKIRGLLKTTAPTKVLLRLSGFQTSTLNHLAKSSRFGIPLSEVNEAFDLLQAQAGNLLLSGFAFHLDTVAASERLSAIEKCLELFEQAIERGFEPQVLNIGGGFRVNYLQDQHEWSAYSSALKESVLGTGQPLTWQKSGFGMHVDGGQLKGSFNTYGYYEQAPGCRFLEEILSSTLPNMADKTVAEVLRSNMIQLWIEPGRSIVDQCGVTIARVNSLRKASTDEQLVCLNMKRQDIAFLDQEVFVDPIILYRNKPQEAAPHKVPVFFAGDLCLESDLIHRHLTFLQQLPEEGDLIAFINTAGYFMDFSACQAIMQPAARKVAVCEQGGEFVWIADEQYNPLWSFYEEQAARDSVPEPLPAAPITDEPQTAPDKQDSPKGS
jgi:diaminopimelate decarboxylase